MFYLHQGDFVENGEKAEEKVEAYYFPEKN